MSYSSSKKRIIGVLAIGAVIGAGALFATQKTLHYTSTTEFCTSCHSQSFPAEEWRGTLHYSNATGIRAGCQDCHIPHEGLEYLTTKIGGLKDVYAELMGKIPDAEAFEEHRAYMAQVVWDKFEKNDSVTCRSCHNTEAWDLFSQTIKAAEEHRSMAESGETCIDCHRGTAHFPPERTDLAGAAEERLVAVSEQTNPAAKTLYPIARRPLFTDRDKTTELGSVMPTTPMNVLSSDGEMLAVEIKGFQQESAQQVVYAGFGKRIISAILSEDAVAGLQTGEYRHDEASGNQWREVTFDAWVSSDHLLDSQEPLWAYGADLNDSFCGGCHAVIEAPHFTANQWPSIVTGMADRTSISDSAQQILTYYLQNHAKDQRGNGHE